MSLASESYVWYRQPPIQTRSAEIDEPRWRDRRRAATSQQRRREHYSTVNSQQSDWPSTRRFEGIVGTSILPKVRMDSDVDASKFGDLEKRESALGKCRQCCHIWRLFGRSSGKLPVTFAASSS